MRKEAAKADSFSNTLLFFNSRSYFFDIYISYIFSCCANCIFALTAFDDCVCNGACNQLNCTDCIVITRNDIINFFRITVGINNSNNRDTQFLCFSNSYLLFSRVNYDESTRQTLHFFDTAQELFELFSFVLQV